LTSVVVVVVEGVVVATDVVELDFSD